MPPERSSRRSRAGRPRHTPENSDLAPREQILEAAGGLFTTQGFAATSTREIAEVVGMRQASLYYHFSGKEAILAELLEMTLRPTLDSLDDLAQLETDEARLYTLALRDAHVLNDLQHNIGILPTLPDVAVTMEAKEYEAARYKLRQAYATLGVSCASDAVNSTVSKRQLGVMIIQQVEGVIRDRVTGHISTDSELHAIAAACLRVCGVPQRLIEGAARTCVL